MYQTIAIFQKSTGFLGWEPISQKSGKSLIKQVLKSINLEF